MVTYCKLTEQNIYEIRELCKQKISKKIIAKKYKVHVNTIYFINSRKIWDHII